MTIWKVETVQSHNFIEDKESDDVATYSTNGYDIESMLELEDDGDQRQSKLSEVKLSSDRDLPYLLEKEVKRLSKKSEEDKKDDTSRFHSRVCRYSFGDDLLVEAMDNLIPLERR